MKGTWDVGTWDVGRDAVIAGVGSPRRPASPVRVVRERLSQIIKALPRGPVITTENGRPCAALVSLEEGTDLEAFLVAHNPGLMRLIERGMAQRGGVPLEEVEAEVARRGRGQKGRR